MARVMDRVRDRDRAKARAKVKIRVRVGNRAREIDYFTHVRMMVTKPIFITSVSS